MTDKLLEQALKYMESVGQMYMYPEDWQIVVALRERLTRESTHSEECWRWHHECAVAKLEKLAQPEQEPDYWQEEARRYAANADYWREKYKALAQPEPEPEPVTFYRCKGCGHAYEQIAPSSCDCANGEGFKRVDYYTRPCAVFKPRLSIDGNKWCAVYGDNLQDGVAGFGESPAEAMSDFDRNWNTELPAQRVNNITGEKK